MHLATLNIESPDISSYTISTSLQGRGKKPPINVNSKKTVKNCLWVGGFEDQLFKKVLILKIENFKR